MCPTREVKVADTITIRNVMCDNLCAVKTRNPRYFNIYPEFTSSNGLSGLLMSEVSRIAGGDLYNIDVFSLRKEVLPFSVESSKYVQKAESNFSEQLINLLPEELRLSGVVDVKFHDVNILEIESFDFSVYNIAYTSITVKLVSNMYYFVDRDDDT